MSAEATISAAVLTGIKGRLESDGVDVRQLGRGCGVADTAWRDEAAEVPLTVFVDLLERAAETSADPAFGWHSGGSFDFLTLGEVGEAVLEAPTLGAALKTFSRYLRLIQTTSEITLDVEDDKAVISYRILDPDIWPRQQDAEFSMSIITGLIRACAGADWRPTGLAFEHRPSQHESVWREEVCADCVFDTPVNAVELPVSVLDRPMPTADGTRWRRHNETLDRVMAARELAMPTEERVTRLVFAWLGRREVDQVTVARGLGLSRRSLRRRLMAEGCSFSEIVAECRMRIAIQALSRTDQSLAQIALDLGYSDQTAFTRAFRQAGGLSPGEFRKQACAPEAPARTPRSDA